MAEEMKCLAQGHVCKFEASEFKSPELQNASGGSPQTDIPKVILHPKPNSCRKDLGLHLISKTVQTEGYVNEKSKFSDLGVITIPLGFEETLDHEVQIWKQADSL